MVGFQTLLDNIQNDSLFVFHTAASHWIAVSNIGCRPFHWRIFDSLKSLSGRNFPDEEVKANFRKFYSSDKNPSQNIFIQRIDVQQQDNSYDCGVFSLAYLTCLVLNRDPSIYEFDRKSIRDHLRKTLAAAFDQITGDEMMFPFISDSRIANECTSFEEINISERTNHSQSIGKFIQLLQAQNKTKKVLLFEDIREINVQNIENSIILTKINQSNWVVLTYDIPNDFEKKNTFSLLNNKGSHYWTIYDYEETIPIHVYFSELARLNEKEETYLFRERVDYLKGDGDKNDLQFLPIAALTSICFGKNPFMLKFKPSVLREHINNVLSRNTLTSFPIHFESRRQSKIKRKYSQYN